MNTESTIRVEYTERIDNQSSIDYDLIFIPNYGRTKSGYYPISRTISKATILTSNKSVEIPLEQFNQWNIDRLNDMIRPVLCEAISNLIKSREYLGLQLSFEFGNIDEKEFEQLEKEYLTEQIDICQDELKEHVDMIIQLTNRVYNSEEISTMFNCSIDTSEAVLNTMVKHGASQWLI